MKFLLNILIAVYFLLPLSSAWSLDECPGSPLKTKHSLIPSSWNNCKGTFIFTDKGFEGNKYIGSWKNRNLHGQGTYYYLADNEFKGNKYVGEYKDGKANGQGTYTFGNGENYVGNWISSMRNGQGTNFYKNGDKYVGKWKDDLLHGQGTYYYLADNQYKGSKYIGGFNNNKRNKFGTYYFADGSVVEGQWKDDKCPDCKEYAEGEYIEDKVVGQKKSTLSKCVGSPEYIYDKTIPENWNNCYGELYGMGGGVNGHTYKGEFKNGLLNGYGIYTYNEPSEYAGTKYVGEYKNGKREGQGTFTSANGDKYVGEFKDDKKNGQGTFYFLADNEHKGDKYVGEHKDDNKHGKGTYTWPDGHEYVGEFKGDKYNGQGTLFWPDGRVWDGQWKDEEWVRGKKYAKGEYNSSVVANNNAPQNEINQEAIEQERRKAANERMRREQLERELAELKAQKKKEKESIASDIDPPKITITSSNVQDKRATIKGKVSDNIEVAELTIDGRRVSISNSGSFTHNLFVPQDGIKVSIEATDNSGLTTKEIITLERNETEKTKVFSFAKLNPLNIKGKKNKNSIALIIGISKYSNAPEAKYADRDANYFSDFAENVLGINETNIKLISNNSANSVALKKALKIWLKGYSKTNLSDIYIFFAGHGLASTDGKELYLLPYDGEPRLLEDTALLRSEIFDTVKSINPKSVTVFLDACYSGQTREKDMILADARPIAIVPVESDVPENFTVFSASSGSEISGSLPEADHGLFSYFLMKGLEGDADANNDRKITNAELHTYVRSNVTRQAVRLGREQTPQLQGDENRVLVEFN